MKIKYFQYFFSILFVKYRTLISSSGKQYFSFFKSKLTNWYQGVIQRLQVKKMGGGSFFSTFSSNELVSGDDENRTPAKAIEIAKQTLHKLQSYLVLLGRYKIGKITYCKKYKTVMEKVLVTAKIIFMYRERVQLRNGVEMHN